MNLVSIPSLIAAGVAPTQARIFVAPLNAALEQYDITTKERIAGFIAQAIHESAGFSRLEENLFYTTPERIRQIFPSTVKSIEDARALTRNPKALANRVYANRNGNGPEASGDGWNYRGRGVFQTTGKTNYNRAAMALGAPFLARPELVATPMYAVLTAALYWSDNRCNNLSDRNDFDGTTRAINGVAMAGAAERRELFTQGLEAFA